MQIAITGATGFLGRYIVAHLSKNGHRCRLWCRKGSDRSGFETFDQHVEWVEGGLGDAAAAAHLVHRCDGVVHAALDRPGPGFRGAEGDLVDFVQKNVLGSLQLIEEARAASVGRFIYVSSCAVHERILDDRPLDEAHPLWPMTHYGAHKAAVEKFVHSYGWGDSYPICAVRPTGIYGLAHPAERSKWYDLVRDVTLGKPVTCRRGGKEVHAADVARAIQILLEADAELIRGQAFACYDRYVSDYEVATLARDITGSHAEIDGEMTTPRHQIDVNKIKRLGLSYGGTDRLKSTIGQMVEHVRSLQ